MVFGVINFISNIADGVRSGGFSAMSSAACDAFRRTYPVHFVGSVNPGVSLPGKLLSKLRRVIGLPGDFFFYAPVRLRKVAEEVDARCRVDAVLDFFHGFTPWILTRPARRYMAWSDCTFRDYIEIFHQRAQFNERDLRRIEMAEAAWLRGARRVLFTSRWAAARAHASYGLDEQRVGSVGIFGESELPDRDSYVGGMEFLFVSTDFVAKGGPVVLSAFRRLRERHPEASLVVIGDRPSAAHDEPGLSFTGFLRKEVEAERRRFEQLVGAARAIIHPTRRDIAPLLLLEAGYHGCPVVASRNFAIPEVVEDGRTGVLLEDPASTEEVTAAMARLIERPEEYAAMRRAAWSKSRGQHRKAHFETKLLSHVADVLAEEQRAAS